MPDRRELILGVDLDGVCADYETALRNAYASRRGIDPATLPPQTTMDAYSEWGLSPEEYREEHRHAVVENRLFRVMRPLDGVSEALWSLSDKGVWIRIITHRLFFNGIHEVVAADTANWLDEHNIPYRDLCFIGAKPDVGADLYIDDAPHNVLALRTKGREVIVFDQPYNQQLPGPRAFTWADVVAHVEAVLARDEWQLRLFPT
jgi:5'(3')-deoxyribonucleotidase